jgi:lipoic acid synthetase
MVLGEVCTRGCRFCNVKTGNPNGWLDSEEPEKVAQSAHKMGLKYVVITMVDRDDLSDGGAAHVASVVRRMREVTPDIGVELLVGDFGGSDTAATTILAERPEVYAHNLETVERLSPRVRDARAKYRQSLRVLGRVKELADYRVYTKSALMLGLGEEKEEVIQALADMREVGVDFITIGQYLRPTRKHLSIKRFVEPKEFDEIASIAKDLGFLSVASGPLVRSSFKAREFYEQAVQGKL